MLRQASTLLTFVILNEVKDLAHCPTRFFATEAQNDRQGAGSRERLGFVILNEVKNLNFYKQDPSLCSG